MAKRLELVSEYIGSGTLIINERLGLVAGSLGSRSPCDHLPLKGARIHTNTHSRTRKSIAIYRRHLFYLPET